jgi:hypothetical protein
LIALVDHELPEIVRKIAARRCFEFGDLLGGVAVGGELWDLQIIEAPELL